LNLIHNLKFATTKSVSDHQKHGDPALITMNSNHRIRNATLGVIIGMVLSVWWILMGLDSGFPFQASDPVSYWLTLGEHRHTIMTILTLFLIPVCALEKKWGFSAAMVLGVVTLALSLGHVVYMVNAETAGYRSQLFGPLVWSILQIPIVVFGYKARQELSRKTSIGSGV
jgi:hypothetical protein